MLLPTDAPAINEQQVVDYALDPANQERFAELLTKILPRYAAWLWGQDNVYRRYFNRWQQAGFNLSPNHYYSPIPNVARLSPKILDARSEMAGIDWRIESQFRFLREVCSRFRPEYERFPLKETGVPHQFYLDNGAFGKVDAEVLHCMIRHYRPRRVIEIGSGCSTLVTAAALELNRLEGAPEAHFTAIEPYPTAVFRHRIPGLTELLRRPLEEVDLALFQELGENDVLFVDSTHAVRCGGDVNQIYLEILPRTRTGVVVHVHDIFLPAEYPKKWLLEEHIFWTEQYLLQAFLAFNRAFEVLWGGSYMHLEHSSELARHFPCYRNDAWPGSFWMRRAV
jgi:predicted O-methyltransferase YrrM